MANGDGGGLTGGQGGPGIGPMILSALIPGFGIGFARGRAQKLAREQESRNVLLNSFRSNPELALFPSVQKETKKLFGDELLGHFVEQGRTAQFSRVLEAFQQAQLQEGLGEEGQSAPGAFVPLQQEMGGEATTALGTPTGGVVVAGERGVRAPVPNKLAPGQRITVPFAGGTMSFSGGTFSERDHENAANALRAVQEGATFVEALTQFRLTPDSATQLGEVISRATFAQALQAGATAAQAATDALRASSGLGLPDNIRELVPPVQAAEIERAAAERAATTISGGLAQQAVEETEVLSRTDAALLIDPNTGHSVPFGTTKGEARKLGTQPVTATAVSSAEAANAALDILSEFEVLIPEVYGGVEGRIDAVTNAGFQIEEAFTNPDSSAALWRGLLPAAVQIARALGEKGALSDADREAAIRIVGSVTFHETESSIRRKLGRLRKIFEEKIIRTGVPQIPTQKVTVEGVGEVQIQETP